MSTATLSPDTMTPMLPFDFDGFSAALVEEEALNSDRELCQRYLGLWADNFGKTKRDTTISFEEFTAAAARLAA